MLIDNANLLQMCKDCGAVGFVPTVSYAYDAAAGTVTLTNTSTIPAGDTLKIIKCKVVDSFGGYKSGDIVSAGGFAPVVINVTTLNRNKPLGICVDIQTVNHIAADGMAIGFLQAVGTINMWDVQKNA